MKNQDALKKHHFWILAGLAPVLVLVAVVMMKFGVAETVAKEAAAIKADVTKAKGTRPPGEGVLEDLAAQEAKLAKKKGELWQENWNLQKPFFAWPKPPVNTPTAFDKFAKQKFGSQLRETVDEFTQFTKAYPVAYAELGGRIAPTKYAGGSWKSVLRYVTDWGAVAPRSEQIWLALEDLWVQRAMLEPIRVVNDTVSRLDIVPDPKLPAGTRLFRSRNWDLTLAIDPKAKMIRGKIRNRTPQLQLVGVNNTMKLNLYFENTPGVAPFEFRVEGEFVPGDYEAEIPPLLSHVLPAGTVPTEIVRVEQVLDDRTVPVRRLDALSLGYLSARYAKDEKKPPTWWPADAAAAVAAANPAEPAGAGPGAGRGPIAPGGDPAAMMAGGGAAAAAQSGPPATVLDGNKLRYTAVTEQVRRMPVAFVVVVDQAYIQDVLIAYTNSPFRFQVVQYHWKRFHGSLGGGGAAAGPGGAGDSGEEGSGVGGVIGQGLGTGMGMGRGMPGGPPPGMMMPGGMPPGMQGPAGGGSSSSVSEAQANSGLVSLTVYGLISIYEQLPEEKKDDAAAPAPAADPAAQPAVDPAAKPAEAPAAATPMPMGTPPAPTGTPAPMPPTGVPPMPMGTPPAATPPATTPPPAGSGTPKN